MTAHHPHADEPDPYRVLGVSRGAAIEEINTAYRAAVRRVHPDTAHNSVIAERSQRGQPDIRASLHQLQAARARLLACPLDQARPSLPGHWASPSATPHATFIWVRHAPHSPPPHPRNLIAGPVRYHGPIRATS
jgi:hypothetical protein